MKIIFLHHKSSRNLIRAAFFWPTLTRWWTLQLIRSGYYFTINQRRGRHGALSHLTALPCNLIVPELHQFPEQSIPPLAGCRQPYTLDQYAPFNMSSIVQASQPESQEAALLAWRVPGFKPVFHHSFFFLFAVSPLTGWVFPCSFENQDVARMWWDPWGSKMNFWTSVWGQSGLHRQY